MKRRGGFGSCGQRDVAPFAGAWIETQRRKRTWQLAYVAPFAGAWIETQNRLMPSGILLVAPFAGAWIETHGPSQANESRSSVAPFAGAWIETTYTPRLNSTIMSLPSRERGLKQRRNVMVDAEETSLPSRERRLKHEY